MGFLKPVSQQDQLKFNNIIAIVHLRAIGSAVCWPADLFLEEGWWKSQLWSLEVLFTSNIFIP